MRFDLHPGLKRGPAFLLRIGQLTCRRGSINQALARFRQLGFASIGAAMTYNFAKPAWHYRALPLAPRWVARSAADVRGFLHRRRHGHTHALEDVARGPLQ